MCVCWLAWMRVRLLECVGMRVGLCVCLCAACGLMMIRCVVEKVECINADASANLSDDK